MVCSGWSDCAGYVPDVDLMIYKKNVFSIILRLIPAFPPLYWIGTACLPRPLHSISRYPRVHSSFDYVFIDTIHSKLSQPNTITYTQGQVKIRRPVMIIFKKSLNSYSCLQKSPAVWTWWRILLNSQTVPLSFFIYHLVIVWWQVKPIIPSRRVAI